MSWLEPQETTLKKAAKIIDTFQPLGNFYCYESKHDVWSAIDNSTGDAFVEEFKTKQEAIEWLRCDDENSNNNTSANCAS